MTGRVLAEAVCRKDRHVLGELVPAADGRFMVRVPRHAVARLRDGRIHRKRGGLVEEALLDEDGDAIMNYPAVCGCGVTHLVRGADLAHAYTTGEYTVIVNPMR